MKLHIEADPNLDDVALPFRNFKGERIDQRLADLMKITHRKIWEEAPVRTGNLRRAILMRKRGKFSYEILVDRRMRGGKYEHFVRLGTRPHSIYPKVKKALFWVGLPHPVKYVKRHPGTKPDDYWDRGIERAAADIQRAEELIGSDIVQELTR